MAELNRKDFKRQHDYATLASDSYSLALVVASVWDMVLKRMQTSPYLASDLWDGTSMAFNLKSSRFVNNSFEPRCK